MYAGQQLVPIALYYYFAMGEIKYFESWDGEEMEGTELCISSQSLIFVVRYELMLNVD